MRPSPVSATEPCIRERALYPETGPAAGNEPSIRKPLLESAVLLPIHSVREKVAESEDISSQSYPNLTLSGRFEWGVWDLATGDAGGESAVLEIGDQVYDERRAASGMPKWQANYALNIRSPGCTTREGRPDRNLA